MASVSQQSGTELHVAVGSKNPVKVNAAKEAFVQMFPGRLIIVHGYAVPSGVADQPVGYKETLKGAVNRAEAAAAAHTGEAGVEFSVGLEGGVVASGGLQLTSKAAPAPKGSDSDASVGPCTNPLTSPSLSCFAYMAVLHCASGTWGHAATGSFPLPPPVVALVAAGHELGEADDMVFHRSNSKQSNGAVRLLTHGLIDRTTYYVHAMLLALTAFAHPQHYGTPPVQGHLGQAEAQQQ